MSALLYTQIPGTRLYAASPAQSATGMGAAWIGFLAGAGSDAERSATLTPADAWTDAAGVFLFFGAVPGDLPGCVAALAAWLGSAPTRVLWLINPDAPILAWRALGWQARLEQSGWILVGRSVLRLGDYRVSIPAGTALTLDTSGTAQLVVAAGGTSFTGPATVCQVDGASTIDLEGASAGLWSGPVVVPASGLAGLGVALGFAVRASRDPADARIQPLQMPILDGPTAALDMLLGWDPLWPTGPGTALRIAGAAAPIPSSLVTSRGATTTLTPVQASAPQRPGGFRFGSTPLRQVADSGQVACSYHLTPDGAYDLVVIADGDPPAGGEQLMLSSSGLESLSLRAGPTRLHFCAGSPAFAPGIAADGVVAAVTAPLLTDQATTAWVAVLPSGGDLDYLSRASPTAIAAAADDGWIAVMPQVMATLAETSDPDLPVPIGAFAGLPADRIAAAQLLDAAAFAAQRQSILAAQGPAPIALTVGGRSDTSTSTLAASPQGLVTRWSGSPARMVGAVIANLPGGAAVEITVVGEDLRQALLSNQTFLVVADPATFATQANCQSGSIDLGDWSLLVDPATWPPRPEGPATAALPLMIWKFADRSLEELVADTAAWSWPQVAQIDGSLDPAWSVLQATMAQARQDAADGGSGPLAVFYREIASRPGWCGVLVINCPLTLRVDGPDGLAFLATGVDLARLRAHHLACAATPIEPQGTLGLTAVSALVDYRNDIDQIPDVTMAASCTTMQLQARFVDGRLSDLCSTIELAINRLFGSPVLLQEEGRGNNLLIRGTLQRTGGGQGCTYVLASPGRFTVLGAAVEEIEITALRLTQASAQNAPAGSQAALVAVALDGRLRFVAPAEVDLFSYGATQSSDGTSSDGWLAFTHLTLGLARTDPAVPDMQIWTEDLGALTLDVAASRSRPDSLAACFPVTPRAIISRTEGGPQDLGYIAIAAPLAQTPLTAPWYGLVLALDLGNLGALAGAAGISGELLVAWSPGAGQARPMFLGLKLAGTSTRLGSLPLQGVLNLGFSSIFLTTSTNTQGRRTYRLTLSRVALSLLGYRLPQDNLDVALVAGSDGRTPGQLGWLAAYDPTVVTGNPAPRSLARTWIDHRAITRRRGRIPVAE